MLPVVVAAIREKRAGTSLISEFLLQTKKQLRTEQSLRRDRRHSLASAAITRRERQILDQCFELSLRAHSSFERALSALDDYLLRQDDGLLEQALLQYQTAERFEAAMIKAKVQFSPPLSRALGRAS